MLLEPELDEPGKLLDALVNLLGAPERLAAMAAAARTQAHPGAAERIAGRLAEMAENWRSRQASKPVNGRGSEPAG